MDAIIEVADVTKTFHIPSVRRSTVREHALDLFRPRPATPLRVLDSVTFEVHRGETVGIMGRNGSGKSTLLKIVAGIYTADRGRVSVRAPVTPILELGVGWHPELDAVDNILLAATVLGLSLREARAAIEAILDFAELAPFAHLKLLHYSTGISARLAYAVAFHAVREILIIDEVFAVGDLGFRAKCEVRHRALAAQGHTVVVVSHDPRIVRNFCDRAVLLEGGRVKAAGDPGEVVKAYLAVTGAPPSAAPEETT